MQTELQAVRMVLNDLLINYYHSELVNPKKTLVFLHGWRSNSALWSHVSHELFKQEYQIYAIDFPGFGLSQKPNRAFFIQDYADIVTLFMEKMEIKKPVLIGHSHGGGVAIKIATTNPKLLDRLVLVDSAGIRTSTSSKTLKKGVAKLVKPLFQIPFMKPLRTKIYQAMGAEDYVATPELTQTYLNIIGEDLTPLLHSIQSKTLLLWGENDTDTPIPNAEIMAKQIPHSELFIIKNAGHFSFLDQPETFVTHLQKFIAD